MLATVPGTKVDPETYPLSGVKLRVCRPDSKELTLCSENGEIHVGGLQVVYNYWLSSNQSTGANNTFYDDEEGHWLVTGQGDIMYENVEVTVTGRYKDIIICGGENISPASIEQCLLVVSI